VVISKTRFNYTKASSISILWRVGGPKYRIGKYMQFLIKRTTLTHIRESRNMRLEHVSDSSGISIEELTAWESTDSQIEATALKKLGKVYGKNWIAFLAEDASKAAPVVHDTRIGQNSDKLDADIILALEEIKTNLQIANDYGLGPELDLPGRKDVQPEELGDHFREFFDISFAAQKETTKELAPFKFWTDVLYSHGILVFQKSLKRKGVRAFSIQEGSRAAITLNTEDSQKARTFSLFHELAHIYRNDTGLCDFYEKRNKRFSKEEAFCNAFAAAFLMPLNDIYSDKNYQKLVKNNIDSSLVKAIAGTFQVSELAVYRRLVTTELLKLDDYLKIQASIALRFAAAPKEEKRGGGGYYTTLFSHTGAAFISSIMDAYGAGKIEHRQIGSILGINPKLIPEVRERLIRQQ